LASRQPVSLGTARMLVHVCCICLWVVGMHFGRKGPTPLCACAVLCAPAGYSKEEGQRYPWPVLYCNDGQNVFGDCTTLSGDSWRVAHTAAELIASGRLPPFMVVGLDHAGPLRSLEYTPYTPGSGPGGFRWGAGAAGSGEGQGSEGQWGRAWGGDGLGRGRMRVVGTC
jgi:hypothetical protein